MISGLVGDLPAPERVHQALATGDVEVARRKSTYEPDRSAHLREVCDAEPAPGEMPLEALDKWWSERTFEILGDQLDQFLARQIVDYPEVVNHARARHVVSRAW